MKIVRLIEEFPPEINRGLSPNVYYISREQVKQGHQVWVFSFTKEKSSKETKDGINIIRIPRPSKIRWNGGLSFTRAIKKEGVKPDIVHGLNCIPFGWRFNRMKKILDTKYAMSLHTSILPLKHGYIKGFKNIIQNYEFEKLAKYLAKKVDLILPISSFIKEELLEYDIPSTKIEVIPQGIDLQLFSRSIKKDTNIFPLKKINLLYIGRFSQMKGLQYLIKACKLLKDNNIDFELKLIGGKNKDDDYENIISMIAKYKLNNKVKIIPPISQDKLLSFYQTADLFILPSIYEPMGKVILEAQAAGVPVIATKAGGVKDIFGNKSGLLIPTKDSKSIFKTIINLSQKENLYHDMTKRGQDNARKYQWTNIASQYSNIFNQI